MNLNSLAVELPAEPLLRRTGIHERLSGAGLAHLPTVFADLVGDQNERLAAGEPVSRIPILWTALAETVGLIVDNDGRIIDGPRAVIPGL